MGSGGRLTAVSSGAARVGHLDAAQALARLRVDRGGAPGAQRVGLGQPARSVGQAPTAYRLPWPQVPPYSVTPSSARPSHSSSVPAGPQRSG